MSRPNWFFAFPIDGSWLEALPPLPANFRRFHRDDVHLTLAFLGTCGEEAALRGLAHLDELLEEQRPSPVHVSLGEVVPMGPKKQYSALSALLVKGRAETETLMRDLGHPVLFSAVSRKERRPPKAHVTIARPRRAVTEQGRAEGLAWAQSLHLSQRSTTLDTIALYTWDPQRRERLFRVVASRTLGS